MVHVLRSLRRQEKAQTLFYRALSTKAGVDGLPDVEDRLNGLLADEQHHLSRLTARLMELGADIEELSDLPRPDPSLEAWEAEARSREEGEVAAYEAALESVDDAETVRILAEILESERHHARVLGGKWMPA